MSHSNAANLSMSLSTFGSIRKTEDAKVSVYDLISVVGGKKEPHVTWKRLCTQYPEVPTKCHNLKFPGAGQRNTPVTDKEGALYIIGLLPGAVGKTYREEAAKLVLEFLEAPEKLAERAIDRIQDNDKLDRVIERAEGKKVRNQFTDELKARGVDGKGYATVSNSTYRGMFGVSTKTLKEERGITKNTSLRDTMSQIELAGTRLAELLAIEKMGVVDAQGTKKCASCAYQAAENVSKAIQTNRNDDIPVYNF